MRARRYGVMVVALIVLLALFAFAASAMGPQDHWSGVWRYTADGGKTYGLMHLKLYTDNQTLSGPYTSQTSGAITGSLNHDFGPVWCGTFRDTRGKYRNKGKFCVTLQSDTVSFVGWYKICGYLTCGSRIHWSGEKQ